MTDIIDKPADAMDTGRQAPAPAELTPYIAPLPVPPVLGPASGDVLRETEIALRPAWVRLHPQLPPTLMWGYDGQVPGPTIEVRRGQRVRIAYGEGHTGRPARPAPRPRLAPHPEGRVRCEPCRRSGLPGRPGRPDQSHSFVAHRAPVCRVEHQP